VPAEQFVHADALKELENEPAEQFWQAIGKVMAIPVEKVPSLQEAHADALGVPIVEEYVPAGHAEMFPAIPWL